MEQVTWEGEEQAAVAVGTFKDEVRRTYRRLRPLGMRREQVETLLEALLRGSITEAEIEEICQKQKSFTDQDAAELEEILERTTVSARQRARTAFRPQAVIALPLKPECEC
jgi:hypothetical protein